MTKLKEWNKLSSSSTELEQPPYRKGRSYWDDTLIGYYADDSARVCVLMEKFKNFAMGFKYYAFSSIASPSRKD